MGRELSNEFSWSKSRHEKLSECARAYYLHYYGSWGGWEDNAPPAKRQLYILKKLGNRWTWAGQIVHDTIRNVLLDIRGGLEVKPEPFIERAHAQMRADFAHSRAKRYWQEKNRRDFSGLVEHEYGDAIAADEWKRNWESARAALQWFFTSRWIPLAKSLRPEQWIEIDNRSFDESVFTLDGVRVFAVPDFAYRDDDGRPVVVDWKTGHAREGYDEQVLGYAMYLGTKYGFAPETTRAALVYLNGGLERVVEVDATALASFRAHFQRSVTRMRELLADPARNVPKPEAAFAMTGDLSACARCVFRRACGREGVAIQAA